MLLEQEPSMSHQSEMFPTDNRYDVWKCAKCGAVRIIEAVPHRPPTCCGTGMWYHEGRLGKTYTVEYEADEIDRAVIERDRMRWRMRDV
jgi:hypothetical protein